MKNNDKPLVWLHGDIKSPIASPVSTSMNQMENKL
jgi:hypothetical protein